MGFTKMLLLVIPVCPAPVVSVLENRHILQNHYKKDVMCDHM